MQLRVVFFIVYYYCCEWKGTPQTQLKRIPSGYTERSDKGISFPSSSFPRRKIRLLAK